MAFGACRYGVEMGVRDAFVGILSMGSAGPVNEDQPVELVVVPLFDGQLVVAELRNSGIEATAIESFDLVTKNASDARIMVRRGDLEAAHAVIADRFSHEIE